MKLLLRPFGFSLLLAGVAFPGLAGRAAGPAVETVARLGGTPDGYHPSSALVTDGSGFYFGTTEAGGPANCGTIYRVAPDGTLTTLYALTGGDGVSPRAALVSGGDGAFYGTTSSGGVNGTGTVFKITPAGVFTSLHSFGAYDAQFHNADGATPQAALVQGGDGSLCGTTMAGGTAGNGTVFRLLPDGTFNLLHVFSLYADGVTPMASLRVGPDQALYGSTSGGGTGSGTIYRVALNGTGFQVLYRFSGGADGGAPATALVLSGGTFYGLTSKTFFSVTTAGALTTLHTFDPASEGASPLGGLSEPDSGGNFYGAAAQRGAGGYGTVFEITPGGVVTVLHSFGNGADGAYPVTPPVVVADGSVYGVASGGFNGNFGSGGTAYQVTAAGAFTTLHAFNAGGAFCEAGLLQGADGNFYGTTSEGGAKGGGTVFAYNPDGVLLGLYDPDPNTEGRAPNAALIDGGDGSLYGTTAGGGPDGIGTLFGLTVTTTARTSARFHAGPTPKTDPAAAVDIAFGWLLTRSFTKEITDVPTFDSPKGVTLHRPPPSKSSQSKALSSDPPVLYGVFQAGASGGGGAVVSYPVNGDGSFLHQFGVDSGDGKLPSELVEGTDGNFYGVTYGGGSAGLGTVFQCGIDGGYAVLYPFQGAGDGAYPQAGLAVGADGNLYGTTSANDANAGGRGTIFRVTPDGTFATIHTFAADGSEGSQPTTALLAAADGNLYGVTSGGGANFGGTVFSVTTGGAFTTLYSFDPYHGAGGIIPQAPLTQATDGNLYGTTTSGGTDNSGTIFRVVLNPSTTPSGNVPVVTLSAAVPEITVNGGQIGEFLLTLSSAPTTDIKVAYTVKGSAAPGVDYVALKGTAKVKAGKTTKVIKVTPEGDLGGADKKVVKLTLATGTGYDMGTTTFVKVKILPAGL